MNIKRGMYTLSILRDKDWIAIIFEIAKLAKSVLLLDFRNVYF